MHTTHDDNATTWRDLADQLTPKQIEHSEEFERQALGDPDDVAALLLDEVREHARKNLRDQMVFGHLAAPIDATRIWHWGQDDNGDWSRDFAGTDRAFTGFDVTISGIQNADGSTNRSAEIYSNDGARRFSADELRAAAALLIEAADELDRLAGTESR